MAGNTISGGNAKKYANYARMGGVVLLVAAGGLWALDLPGMQKLPEKPAPAPLANETPKAETTQQTTKVDQEQVSDAADRLELAWGSRAPIAAIPEPEEDKPEPPPPGPEWTYLGPIKEAGRSLAMVSVDGTQRILAVGRLLGDTKLVGVEDEKIMVETNGARREVPKSSRSGPTVAWLRTMPANTPMGSVGAVAGAPMQAGQMSPEVIQRLRERGIDPSQAQRFQGGGGQGGRNRGQPGGNGNGNGGRGAVNFNGAAAANGDAAVRLAPRPTRGVDADNNSGRSETAN